MTQSLKAFMTFSKDEWGVSGSGFGVASGAVTEPAGISEIPSFPADAEKFVHTGIMTESVSAIHKNRAKHAKKVM